MKKRGYAKEANHLHDEPIKFHADYQRNWAALVTPLRKCKYVIKSTSSLSIHGDAPKCFLLVKEYIPGRRMAHVANWTKYIAKVGSKWYPVESVTEQLIGRIGQVFGFDVAESRLAMVGRQVRFLSRYFLRADETLTHGIEVFQEDDNFGEILVKEIASRKAEREHYTFPVVVGSLRKAFPQEAEEIVAGFIRMLVFDAIVGNNDRHPANWGVIGSVRSGRSSRFSPIFDTARGLFWNNHEPYVRTLRVDDGALDAYIRKSRPQIGWEGIPDLDHFSLLGRIAASDAIYRSIILNATASLTMDGCARMLWDEFGELFSKERLELIAKCVGRRLKRVQERADC